MCVFACVRICVCARTLESLRKSGRFKDIEYKIIGMAISTLCAFDGNDWFFFQRPVNTDGHICGRILNMAENKTTTTLVNINSHLWRFLVCSRLTTQEGQKRDAHVCHSDVISTTSS